VESVSADSTRAASHEHDKKSPAHTFQREPVVNRSSSEVSSDLRFDFLFSTGRAMMVSG
jgi:hypothetical protein